MPPSDLLSALLDLLRAAAHEDSTQALDLSDAPGTPSAPRLVYQQGLAQTPVVSTATVHRLCRPKRIPIVHERDLLVFVAETVRSAICATGPAPVNAPFADPRRATAGRGGSVLLRDRVREASRRPQCLGTAAS
jgi:hypothetical protein